MAGLKGQPEYEDMPQTETTIATATATTTEDETMTTTKTETQTDAGATAALAIAQASAGAVAVAGKGAKFTVAFADKNNVFDTATVEGLALAAPRIKGEQGSLFQGQFDHGSKMHFEMVSFNHRWAIGTGEDDAEAKEFFKVSYDGKTISGTGQDMGAYIESLKAQGFTKAKSSPYLDVWGFITWSENKGDIQVDDRELVCLQCSQTSLGAFTAFSTTRGLLESRGLAKPVDVIEVRAEKRSSGNNKFTNFSFHVPKA